MFKTGMVTEKCLSCGKEFKYRSEYPMQGSPHNCYKCGHSNYYYKLYGERIFNKKYCCGWKSDLKKLNFRKIVFYLKQRICS